MTYDELFAQIRRKKSFLRVGLDPDVRKLPACLKEAQEPLFDFCRAIIDATAPYCVAYKPNTAFFESCGAAGWQALEKTAAYLRTHYPDVLTIADAKRADIGNTSALYARTFFETMDFDAVTVAPYMGSDSVGPFLEFEGKWVVLLALTSNAGGGDFQLTTLASGEPLYRKVLETSRQWASAERMMYVVGATKAEYLSQVREVVPDHFLLVPGVGAQGGSLEEVCRHGMNSHCGLIVNSSRGIIYASSESDFAQAAAREAAKLQASMQRELENAALV